jgi:hypothetical protein
MARGRVRTMSEARLAFGGHNRPFEKNLSNSERTVVFSHYETTTFFQRDLGEGPAGIPGGIPVAIRSLLRRRVCRRRVSRVTQCEQA